MAIVKQPPGMATMYSQAAIISGKAQKALRQEEAARQAAAQMRSIQAQQIRDERSQMRQLETEERAHQWEVEKMDMRSRMDFAEEERARQEKRTKLQSTLDRIDEIDTIPESTKEGLRTKAILEYNQVNVSDRVLFPGLYETTERERVPSRTDVGAAVKFMTEFREKERKWNIPYVREVAPTAEERAAVPYYQDILQKAGMGAEEAGRAAVSMTPVEQDVNINVAPSNEAEFESIVARLKATDISKARAYYEKFAGQF